MHGSCQLQPSGEESLCSPSETIDGLAVDGRSIVISTDSVCHGPESGDSTKGFEETGDTRRKALMRCCMTGDETRLKALLLFNSYDINWQDQSGRTPLSYAASGGHDNVIGFLQENSRVNPNLADNEGNTPLIYSAAMGHDAATLGLLKFPAVDVDQRNSSGFTALMKASIQDHVVCVEQLLSAGASMTLRDGSRGLTAIEWAKFCGSQESYVVLEAAAAAEAQRLQPDVGDGGFKRSTRGSFRSMTRPSSVRIRQAAAHSDKGADHLPSDGAAKAPGQKSGSGTAARLVSFIRRIKLALRFSKRGLKDGADSAPTTTAAETAISQAATVPSGLEARQQQNVSHKKTDPDDDAAGIGASLSGARGSGSGGCAMLRNAKLGDALMKVRARSLLPKIKVTKAPDDIAETDADWQPSSGEPEVAQAAVKSGVGLPRKRDCAGA